MTTKWKRSLWRGILLRVQASSLVVPGLRRRMLNSIGASIHPTAIIKHSCWLGSGDIVMGRNTMLNAFAFYDGEARLTIRDGGRVAAKVTLLTASHEVTSDPARRSSADRPIVAPIVVDTGAWVGADCTILPGVTIAAGCVVGAGAVVRRSTLADGVYVGVPAARKSDLPIESMRSDIHRAKANNRSVDPLQLSRAHEGLDV